MKKLIKKPTDIFDKPLPVKSAATKAEELITNNVITIFDMNNGCDWYQGYSAEDVKKAYEKDVGEKLEDEPRELSGTELDILIYKPDLGSGAPYKCSFREELIWRVKNGNMRTELFASSEY